MTYVMNLGELKFVLILVIEDSAILVNEAHHWGLPAG